MFTIKSYLLPALSIFAPVQAKTPVHRVVKHIHVIGELKDGFAHKAEVPAQPKPANKTPTLSYLKAVEAGKIPHSGWYGPTPKEIIKGYRKDYDEIINLVIKREKELCTDYYVFYHGLSNSWNIFQDFLKQLDKFLAISGKQHDFEFLRLWHEAKKEVEANKFIDKELQNGYNEAIKTFVCVNLSLFGNMYSSASHTFGYFKDNLGGGYSGSHLNETLLKSLFMNYGLDSTYIKDLINLNQKYATKEGRLEQIFIPKEKVDQYVYLSSAGTTPWPAPIVSSIWDSHNYRHTKIAPILDKYIDDPSSISNFNDLQARLLCSQDFMLNPTGGVKIFKYTTMKDKDAQAYEKELKQISDKIFSEWISTKAYQNIKKTSLGRLIEFMK